ncbi:uncharacterized protein PHACADRAFT_30958 [Phanerochaete carnosa HHB-10118-sp]|uniref:N-acetyltransferase domain-containing protein n=1 Tax=Phanerochaete carnosa (strain HHB-10118-sp) TaxID=650164 RepID=K5VLY4_PHACS|nr:uncharacterized protein PHACADRAFT_30958 [Phanerochaete carnosa HHB-10118-sp]EKM52438.1 hypothetical protein PHACADRAFT_30958 [Phanerochaete carnosa HHB-10118-sp]
MSFTLGTLTDSLGEKQIKAKELTDASRIVFAVYCGDALVLALWFQTRGAKRAGHRDGYLALVTVLASAIDPQVFSQEVMGPEDLVDTLINAWTSEMAARGLRAEPLPVSFRSKTSFATLATLPSPLLTLSQYRIELATADDVEILARQFSAFTAAWGKRLSIDDARPRVTLSVDFGAVWVCRVGGELAAFCVTRRATACTIALRNVYVDPQHRRKGIAAALTTGMLRYFLGAQPLGFEGASNDPPAAPGVKREVCLNVAEDFVENMYAKCGFLFGEDARDPIMSKRPWIPLVVRGAKMVQG